VGLDGRGFGKREREKGRNHIRKGGIRNPGSEPKNVGKTDIRMTKTTEGRDRRTGGGVSGLAGGKRAF